MNKTIAEARAYVDELSSVPEPPGVQPFLLPAHTALPAVRDCRPPGSRLLLGAQNAHWAPEGAVTGEVSMRMVADAGAQLVEMGHSERRAQFGETDHSVSLKARAALDHHLTPLVCVGEPLSARRVGEAEAFVVAQVRRALSDVRPEEIGAVLVAYEPVWAIGAGGRPAELPEVAPVMAAIAETVAQLSAGGGCRALLYGGGVDLDNASALLADPATDGLFVGRAAWTAGGLLQLIAVGAAHAATDKC
jgi:triosephosphate isomerase